MKKIAACLKIFFLLSFILTAIACSKSIFVPGHVKFNYSENQTYSFTGEYDTTWGLINFNQSGNKVEGHGAFTFHGFVKGNSIEGAYSQFPVVGQFYFLMSDDGNYLRGHFSNNLGATNDIWISKRIGPPTRVQKVTADTESDKYDAPIPARTYSEPKTEINKKSRTDISTGTRWAVVIGISSYKDSRIPPLRYANKDAKAFYDWIISEKGGRYAPSQVNLLLDRDATFKNIREALFVWLKQAIEEDVITIYFAGHGSPESPDASNNLFLLPYDAQYDSIATTGFPMWDIETALKRFIKAKKVIVIADACHSGGVGQSYDIARRSSRGVEINPISSGLQNLSRIGDGVAVISASDDKQLSQESQTWGGGHGVFTYFLLKGLKGEADYSRDGSVTLGELIPYVSEQVRRATRNAQSPTISGKFDPALNIGR